MSQYLRGNDRPRQNSTMPESAFAQKVLQGIGGSQVYVEKSKKFHEVDNTS